MAVFWPSLRPAILIPPDSRNQRARISCQYDTPVNRRGPLGPRATTFRSLLWQSSRGGLMMGPCRVWGKSGCPAAYCPFTVTNPGQGDMGMTTSYELQGEYQPPVPSRVIFGRGKVAGLKQELEALGGRRALLLSGRNRGRKDRGRAYRGFSPRRQLRGGLLGTDPAGSPGYGGGSHQHCPASRGGYPGGRWRQHHLRCGPHDRGDDGRRYNQH